MNGKHELRLERIEESLRRLHEKVDDLVEQGAVNRTEITWLKWGLRLLFVAVAGMSGLALPNVL